MSRLRAIRAAQNHKQEKLLNIIYWNSRWGDYQLQGPKSFVFG